MYVVKYVDSEYMRVIRVDYREVFAVAPIGMAISRHRRIVACNAQLAALFHTTEAALIGESFEVLYPSRRDYERRGERIVLELGEDGRYSDDRIMRRVAGSDSGGVFWCHVVGRATNRRSPHESGIWTFDDVSATRALPSATDVPLTSRERQIAAMLLSRRTSRQMADELGISRRTVEVHRAALLRKHAVHTTAELIARLVD